MQLIRMQPLGQRSRGVDGEEALAPDTPDYPDSNLRGSLLEVRYGWPLVTYVSSWPGARIRSTCSYHAHDRFHRAGQS